MLANHLAFVPDVYASYISGDLSTVLLAFADDIVWYSSGPPDLMPTGGERRGKAALVEWFDLLQRDWVVEHYETLEFFGSGDRVAVRARATLRRKATGALTEIEKADLLTVRDGKIVVFREYFDTAGLLGAAGYHLAAVAGVT